MFKTETLQKRGKVSVLLKCIETYYIRFHLTETLRKLFSGFRTVETEPKLTYQVSVDGIQLKLFIVSALLKLYRKLRLQVVM